MLLRLRPYRTNNPRPVLHWSLRIWRKPNCSTNSFANRSIWLIQLHTISSMAVINMNYLAPECSIHSCPLTIFQDHCAGFRAAGKLHKSYFHHGSFLQAQAAAFALAQSPWPVETYCTGALSAPGKAFKVSDNNTRHTMQMLASYQFSWLMLAIKDRKSLLRGLGQMLQTSAPTSLAFANQIPKLWAQQETGD